MNTASENTGTQKSFSLKKAERLSSVKIIEKLFAEGDSVLQFPLKFVFLKTELTKNCPAQTAFTASKKGFKRAVHRNQIKRLLRESYRLNKAIIYDALQEEQLALFIIYIGKEIPEFKLVEVSMKKGLKKITKKLAAQNLNTSTEQE